jgi:flagellar protein FlaG
MEALSAVEFPQIKGSETVLGSSKKDISLTEKTRKDPDKINQGPQSKIENIAQLIKKYGESIQRDLQIQVHKATNRIMIKIISTQDGKIIREIPSEELLDLAAKIEEMVGVLFDKTA